MLALSRFVVVPERTAEFTRQAHAALAALASRPGYRDGVLARSLDSPEHWCLVTRWDSVGAYRRALADVRVRTEAVPLLAQSTAEPSAYETLAVAQPGRELVVTASDRAVDDGDRND
ncbi:MAG: antibiotic biosynthesis monooxygenase [Micromonosporaceae bacterium]